jgi:hypothetical protein
MTPSPGVRSKLAAWARSSTGQHALWGLAAIVLAIALVVISSLAEVDILRDIGVAVFGFGLGILGTGLLTVAHLMDELTNVEDELANIREPALSAAVRVGSSFALVGTPPESRDARFLDVVAEVGSSQDVNDFSEITAALRVRWGAAAAESFLLGRQLTLILVPDEGTVSAETRGQVLERLESRGVDAAVITVVGRVLKGARGMGEEATKTYMQYMATLLGYVSESMREPQAKPVRAQLLTGLAGDAQVEGEDSEKAEFGALIDRLVQAGVHEDDPEVLLFHGVLTGDLETVRRAMEEKHADQSVTKAQLMRRYRNWTAPTVDEPA